jgi:transcription elongation GreA/GreB family factor
MSRAFVKEDVDPPERSRRARAASGLPPGATNYMTARGAQLLRHELATLRRDPEANAERIAELQDVLGSVAIVDTTDGGEGIAFGARVTVRGADGNERAFRIVGVDEVQFFEDAVSWISPNGKALLSADARGRLTLEGDERVEIVRVEYPAA